MNGNMNNQQYQYPQSPQKSKSTKKTVAIIVSVICILLAAGIGFTALAVHSFKVVSSNFENKVNEFLDSSSADEEAINQYLKEKYGEDSSFEIKKLGGSMFIDSWDTEVECHSLNGKVFKHNVIFNIYTDDNDNISGDNLAEIVAGEILRQETESTISNSKVYYNVGLKDSNKIPDNIDDVISNLNHLSCDFIVPFGISEEEFNNKLSALETWLQNNKVDSLIRVYSAIDMVKSEDMHDMDLRPSQPDDCYNHGIITIRPENDYKPIRDLIDPTLPDKKKCAEYLNNKYSTKFTLVDYKKGDFQHPGKAVYSCTELPSPTYNIEVFVSPVDGELRDNYENQLNEYKSQLDETNGGYYPGAEKD